MGGGGGGGNTSHDMQNKLKFQRNSTNAKPRPRALARGPWAALRRAPFVVGGSDWIKIKHFKSFLIPFEKCIQRINKTNIVIKQCLLCKACIQWAWFLFLSRRHDGLPGCIELLALMMIACFSRGKLKKNLSFHKAPPFMQINNLTCNYPIRQNGT